MKKKSAKRIIWLDADLANSLFYSALVGMPIFIYGSKPKWFGDKNKNPYKGKRIKKFEIKLTEVK